MGEAEDGGVEEPPIPPARTHTHTQTYPHAITRTHAQTHQAGQAENGGIEESRKEELKEKHQVGCHHDDKVYQI